MTVEDFKRDLRMCGSEDNAKALFKEAKNILTDKEYAALVADVAGGYVYRAFVRRIAWESQEKR